MRFRSLRLEAFGPFTNEQLDLSGGAPGGLHLIYGPNEAGKSTSLRAVEGLLFGIPERSSDAHLHPLRNLAVGAVLERNAGAGPEELWVTRRKRRKDSLVDAHGEPLPDDALAVWLGGLDQRSFFARFGLDQARLEQGAEALLGGSEEGLFAAGTGGPDVARLLSELRAEEEALYGPRAKRPLNRALQALSDAGQEARRAARPPEKWREQKRAHEQALAGAQALKQKRGELKLELGRLNRLAAVRSDVARWSLATEELEQLGPQPELPPDAEVRRSEAQRAHRDAQREIARLEQELSGVSERLAALPPPSSLLHVEAERWEALEKKIGGEHKAREDRPKRAGRLAAHLDELIRQLARLGETPKDAALERADELRVESALERRAQRLCARYAPLELASSEATRRVEEVLHEHEQVKAAARADREGVDVEALELSLGRARQAMARLARSEGLLAEQAQLERRAARLRQELGTSAPAAALAVGLPPEADAVTAQSEAEKLREVAWRLREARSAEQARHDAAAAALAAQDLAGEVPSEARLSELRRVRDELFDRLDVVSGEPDAVRRWASELTTRIAEADHAADRLRLEAHRVSEREKHLGARETARIAAERLERELEDAEGRLGALAEIWTRRCASLGISAVDLKQLIRIRQLTAELLDVEEQLTERVAALATLAREGSEARAELGRALGSADRVRVELGGRAELDVQAELGALVERAAKRLGEERQDRERRRALSSTARELSVRLEQQRARAEEATERLEEWRSEWRKTLAELGVPLETPPEEVQAMLVERTQLGRIVDDARGEQTRLDGIDRDSAQLADQVRALAERHAPDLLDLDALEAAAELLVRQRAAREVERDRTRLEEERATKSQALSEARRASQDAFGVLEELMQAAGVSDPVELGPIEKRAQRARELVAQRAQLEEVLRSKAGVTGSIEELSVEVRGLSPLEQAAQSDELEAQLEDLEEELRQAEYDASAKGAGLELYHSEAAAVAEQRVAEATAEARQVASRFLVLRAARVLLEREVTRYAERHQGPILARANEHFPRLTLGRYTGLRVGVGEHVLRCLRDGKEIEVGELSRGTRAQLYLALRLASLEHYFAGRPAVPLIFDDLLVDFDDDRACAAFELFGELAERVQILYFTHLERDLQAARDAVPSARLFEHRIGVLPSIAQPAYSHDQTG